MRKQRSLKPRSLLIVLVVLIFVTGFTSAEDLGVTVGVEFTIENIHRDNNSEDYRMPWLGPFVIYENSFLDDALDLYAELSFWFGFFDDNPKDLYFNLAAAYNLFLSPVSTLSFLLENEVESYAISPRPDEGSGAISIFKPGLRFTQSLGFGDVYAQALFPITYLNYFSDADTEVALKATLGWESDFGLGFSLTPVFSLSPDSGYDSLEILATYGTDAIYIEVEVIIPNEFSDYGMTITPEVFFHITGGFGAYLRCEVAGIGAEGNMILAPAVGVTFSF